MVNSDNSPLFASCEFAKFSESYGFDYRTSSDKEPQGNAEAERAIQTIKKLINKSPDLYIPMLNHSPAKLLLERQLRTKIPFIPSKL